MKQLDTLTIGHIAGYLVSTIGPHIGDYYTRVFIKKKYGHDVLSMDLLNDGAFPLYFQIDVKLLIFALNEYFVYIRNLLENIRLFKKLHPNIQNRLWSKKKMLGTQFLCIPVKHKKKWDNANSIDEFIASIDLGKKLSKQRYKRHYSKQGVDVLVRSQYCTERCFRML
jgi:hypothetical protein